MRLTPMTTPTTPITLMILTLAVTVAVAVAVALLNNRIICVLSSTRLLHGLEVRRKGTLHAHLLAVEVEDHGDGHEHGGHAAEQRAGPLDAHALEHLPREQREAGGEH